MSPAASAGSGGLLLLDKPAGWSSTQALGRAKRLLSLRKGGHTGTLDPFATGLLPLAFGEATKFSRFLIDAPKAYLATLHLGRNSTTGDTEGSLTPQVPVSVTLAQIDAVLAGFVGVQEQVPPMYSAVHHEGRRLYDLAREGIEVERTPRMVRIDELHRVGNVTENLVISVKCGKGTYIRTLAEDIGKRLGCGAYLVGLRRMEVAGFEIGQALTLEALEAAGSGASALLLPPEALVASLPRASLQAAEAEAIRQGRILAVRGLAAGATALFGPDERFLGVGQADGAGALAALRLLDTSEMARLP